jgi:N-ethylmaleimide reductase
MSDINLLSPGRIGSLAVSNRLVMAPMTRSRAGANGVPSDISIEYYAQRASAGLILTEGTAPSAQGLGYARTPAIDTPEQIAAWKKITSAVKAKGGHMFMQLMHVGRIGNQHNRYTDKPLVSASALKAAGQIWTDAAQMQDHPVPHALSTNEIAGVIAEYAQATKNALAAGFEGVELHSASGYLPMQFLSTGTNQRTDQYGGSAQNRIRFVVEALDAMIAAAGSADKVGIKISPGMPFNDCTDADPKETYTTLVPAIAGKGLAYLHVLQTALPGVFELLRPHYTGTFAIGGAQTLESGNAALKSGLADFVVYGKSFIANPDLPARFAKGAALNAFDASTFYSPGAKGYTDYPTL